MINLYGNLIHDNVKYIKGFKLGTTNGCYKEYSAIGAIGNLVKNFIDLQNTEPLKLFSAIGDDKYGLDVEKWLSKIKQECEINSQNVAKVANGTTTNALILSDLQSNVRTSVLNWGECRSMTNFLPQKAKWSHILYADTLDNLDNNILLDIKKHSDIVSMDFCLSEYNNEKLDRLLSYLHYVDYLIISDVEAQALTKKFNFNSIEYSDFEASKILSKLTLKGVIIHNPNGSVFCDGNTTQHYKIKKLSNTEANVLGAGDIFCSSVIHCLIQGAPLTEALKFSHEHTTKKIINRKI